MSGRSKDGRRKEQQAFMWTDDEVELLLRLTNEYKVSKVSQNIDWESVQRKYSDILERFKVELHNHAEAEGTNVQRKDYPHKEDEITKLVLTSKLKSIRIKYRQAVDTGKRSGHGRVVLLYFELCESIWGGSPATEQIGDGIESQDINEGTSNDTHARDLNPSPIPINTSSPDGDVSDHDEVEESDGASSSSSQQTVQHRRSLLDAKLCNYKQEKLKRKILLDSQLANYAKEDIELKKRLMDHIDKMEGHYHDNMAKMSQNMEKLSNSIAAGFNLLQGLLVPQQQVFPQQSMYSFPQGQSQSDGFFNPNPSSFGQMPFRD